MAGRSRADVTDILRKQLSDNPRVLTDSPFLNTIVRDWSPAEVIELIEELTDEPEGENFIWQVFHSLPTPPAAFTELILHLWVAVPKVFFDELIPLMYGGDQSSRETAAIIIGLHQEWEPPLDSAARELIDRVIPVIINQTPIGDFEHIGLYLYQAGINVEEIFAPYRQSF